MKTKTSVIVITLCFLLNPGFAQSFIKGFQSVAEMVSMDGILYLVPDDGIHGKELWRSDGTLEGTFLVKDINEGYEGSNPTNLIVYKNEIYFAANDNLHGTELWKSNGTEAGTVLVANIKPDTEPYNNGSLPANFTLYNNLLFFTASDDGNDDDIWKTNGTNAGTVKVHETNSINVAGLTVVGDDLFFVYYYGPRQLWSYNDISGIAAEIFVDDYYEIAELNSFSGTLYFITNTTYRNDIRLYKLTTDKTPVLITEYTHPPYGSIDIDNFTEVNQEVFFSVRTSFDNDPAIDVLWKTDGTPEGTIQIKTFEWDNYLYQSYMSDFINYNGYLYFRSGEKTGCTLWKSDGTTLGTFKISDTRLNKEYGRLTISDDLLFFCGGLWNNELWFSNGTQEGTLLFAEINTDGNSNPSNLCDVNRTLYFSANDGFGPALWNNKPNPEITIKTGSNQIDPNETISFSKIKVDSVEVKNLIITNSGLKELVISKITVSGGDFHIRNKKNIILPNEKDTLIVYFFPASEGHKTGQITICNNDNNESGFVVNLEGTAEGFVNAPSVAGNRIWLNNQINFGNNGDTISISKYSIDENLPSNTLLGTLGVAGENVLDWSFTLVQGIGDEDNTSFYINNNSVYSAKSFDFEVQNTCTINIKATKNTGNKSHEQYFVIQVNNQNEAVIYDACGKTFYNLMYALNDVEFIDAETVFAVGGDGVILKSTDAGENWEQINSGTRASLHEIQFVTENVGYIVGYEDIVLKTENGGNNWFPIEINNPGYPYVGNLFFVTADKGFVVGDDGKIFRTIDGGRTWDYHREGNSDFSSVYFVNELVGFVCGRSNVLYKTTDFGDNWIPVDMENFGWNLWFKDICFTSGQTGYMISNDGDVLKTVDAGDSWALIDNLSTDYATNIIFINENEGYIIGGWSGSTFFKTLDAGNTWQEIDLNDFASLSGISFNPTGEKGCVVGDAAGYGSTSESGRVIYCSADYGNSWPKTNFINGDDDMKEVAFFDNNIGYVFGGDYYTGGIGYKTFDGGISWQQLPVPPLNSYSTGVSKCYFINQDTIFAFSDSVYLTTDGGNTWASKNEFNHNSRYHFIDFYKIYRLDGSSGANAYKSVDAGQTWEQIYNTGNWLTHICFYNQNIGYLLGYSVILKTEDGGETWSEYAHNLSQILNTIVFIDENTALIGGNEGTLLKSTDGGDTWTLINSIIKTNINTIDFFDQKNGIILASNGGGLSNLYTTSDAGETWSFVRQIAESTYKAFVNQNNEIFIIGNNGTLLKYSQILPPSQAGYIVGDEFVCHGAIVDYQTPGSGYFDFLWSIDNNQSISFGNNKATVTWDEPGEYLMELTPVNACGVGLPQTLLVHVDPLPNPEITGKDTITNLELSVVYTSNEYYNDRILWHLDGADSASILNDREIFVTWKNSDGFIELIETTTIGCREKTTKEIVYSIGITELSQDFDINVHPNPTSGFIYFNLPLSNQDSYTLTLFDYTGKRMSINELSFPQTSLYVGNLPAGIYLLNISSDKINKTVKIIIE